VATGFLALAVAVSGAALRAPAECVATWQPAPVAEFALDQLVPQPSLAVRISRTMIRRLFFRQG